MSSKLIPTLAMMPWHIKQRIGLCCDVESRLVLRKLSFEFRQHIDRLPTFYKQICLQIEENQIILIITDSTDNTLIIRYFKTSKGCVVKKEFKKKLIEGSCHVERAILDFLTLVRSPKTHVKTFKIINEECYRRYKNASAFVEDRDKFFKILDCQLQKRVNLNVEKLRTKFPLLESEVLCILPHLNPTTLQHIRIGVNLEGSWDQVTELEQWQQARKLRIGAVEDIPVGNMAHFESTRVKGCKVEVVDLKELIEKILAQDDSFRHFLATDLQYNHIEFQQFLTRFPRMLLEDSEVRVIENDKTTLYVEATENKIHIYNSNFKAEEEVEEEEDSEEYDDCDDYGSCYV